MIDEGTVRGAIAIVSLAAFLGICWWAYRPQSRARFEADGWLVFEDADGIEGGRGRDEDGRVGRGTSGRGGESGARVREQRGASA